MFRFQQQKKSKAAPPVLSTTPSNEQITTKTTSPLPFLARVQNLLGRSSDSSLLKLFPFQRNTAAHTAHTSQTSRSSAEATISTDSEAETSSASGPNTTNNMPEPTDTNKSRQWRAIQVEGKKARDLVLTTEEFQEPGPDEVLVRIRAVSLNFTELLVFDGSFPAIPRVVPCSDMAGDVLSIGSNVTNVKPGDRVTAGRLLGYVDGQLGRDTYFKSGSGVFIDGVLADKKVLPAESLVVIPDHLSYEEGSTLPCVAVTAYNCLFGAKPVQKGDTLLLMGTGGLNMFAAQFASTIGADVIITSSSDEKIEKLKGMGLGLTKFINYVKNPDWDAEVLKLTDGVGASHIIECGGMGTLGKSISCVKMGGWIHAVGFLDKIQKEYVDITFEAIMKNCIVRGVFVGPVTMFKEMNDFITQHQLRPMIDKVYDFEDAVAAFQYLEKKDGFGKIVIRVP